MMPNTAYAPYSLEAEQAVIGAVLVNSSALIDIAPFLKAEDFYILRHSHIWGALIALHTRRDPIDYLTVQVELQARQQIVEVGGPAYLIELINAAPSSLHAEIYGHLVERAAIRRRLMLAADEIKALALDEEKPVETILGDIELIHARIRHSQIDQRDESWSDILGRLMDSVEERIAHPDQLMGIPTGFRELDDLLAGWQKTDLIIVGGRPGMGKTSLLLDFALAAMRAGGRVGFISREMGRDQIAQRVMSSETHINMQKVRLGALDVKTEWARFVEAYGRLGNLPFMVDDLSAVSPASVRAKALRWQREYGLDLLILDYLQLLLPDWKRRESNENADLTDISRSMKLLAKELNVPIIAAAQLNRSLESRQDKHPQLSDLRGSGSLEQDADVVAFLYRDVVYNEATEFPNRADVVVAKHRNGPTGIVSLHFDKSSTHFSDARTQLIDLSALGTYHHGSHDYAD